MPQPSRTRSPEEVAACERMLERLRGNAPRESLVRSVRSAVADDSYENALKMDAALDRLIDDLREPPLLSE